MLRTMTAPTFVRTPANFARRDWTSFAVFAAVTANAATQFAIQAWMTYSFAKDVWKLPGDLRFALVVGLDLFAVVFMVFTFLLRGAKMSVRVYVWLVFAVAVGAQLLAAELLGDHLKWDLSVRIFAALPAVFLAASLHGLILWRRHRSDRTPVAPVPARNSEFVTCPFCGGDALGRGVLREHIARRHPPIATQVPAPVKTPKVGRPQRPTQPPAPPPVSSGAQPKPRRSGRRSKVSDENKASAVARVRAGDLTPAQAAASLGISTRAVQLWVQDAPLQVNGHRHGEEVSN